MRPTLWYFLRRLFQTPANAATRRRLTLLFRLAVVILWVLECRLIGAKELSSSYALPLLIGLAVVTCFTVDNFSATVLSLILIALVNSLPSAEVAGVTKAEAVNLIGLGAVASIAWRLLYPSAESAKTPVFESQTPIFPSTLRHDLQTPISMIRGYCEAIFQMNQTEQTQGKPVSAILQDNVDAIYRNAQQLEKLLTTSFEQHRPQKMINLPQSNTIDLAQLLKQTVAINSDLMTQKGMRTEIHVDGDLSHLPLNSIYLRQIVLNMLRTIALEASPETNGTTVSIYAKANAQTTEISISTLQSIIQQIIRNDIWQQTQTLLDAMNAKVEMQQAGNRLPLAQTLLKLSFPLTGESSANKSVLNTPALTIRRLLLVIAGSQTIVELLAGQLDQYKIIRVETVALIAQALQEDDKVAAVLSVHALTDDELRKIRALIGLQVPILTYPIDTAGDQLRHLKTTYLRKPLDFNRLLAFVKSIPTNENSASNNIIIVEDNPDTAALIAQTIRSISPGLNPHIASIAQDALLLLGKLESAALLIDQSLPGISGIHLIQQIRDNKRYENLPIILMSAYPTADEAVPVAVCNRLIMDHAVGLDLGVLLNWLI